ncbi:DNA repair and recombination protein RAD52, putative [Entamoeba invadens IP1]|uniref:DNA repair and recombination protein RAD52, putative n=1 Tax=Entamoeba invadens IP1 TaxID=370355 RepID=A0A0A1UCM6_ENTIV|nr:DNA repair and recombination protein RAD52, putative [Entamoeba invadens IP1]ELP91408.1 DNA repair and recombination protein RAD52, putative [Entamoeba invadens IP1]|eukprot:XP_004258179.1 DNA repair and recombination protein RAD52, putative [Entamoeba invadens IP1]
MEGSLFGTQSFTNPEQIQQILEQKVPVNYVSVRPGPSNMKLTYLESWRVVELSNALFGFDGWSSCITNLNVDYVDAEKGKYKVGVTAVVRVTLKNGSYHEDVGVGMAEMPRKGAAIELAKKEAVSDARKRALRLFGNYLGNSLYDTDYVRQLDTNHKQTILEPLTFNSVRESTQTKTTCENSVASTPMKIIKPDIKVCNSNTNTKQSAQVIPQIIQQNTNNDTQQEVFIKAPVSNLEDFDDSIFDL